jgi:subtilisin-like proprotein convertase family protein
MNNERESLMKTASKLLGTTVAAVTLGVSLVGHAGIYNFTTSGGGVYTVGSGSISQVIPDNTPSGVAYALNFGATGLQISDVTVTLNISGGWNGDLYAYLSHGDGFAVLLNRVGTTSSGGDGYGNSGLNIVLKSTGATYGDIHSYQNESGYATKISDGSSWQADGRINYTDTARNNQLDVFNAMNPSGAWTLFFADMAAVNTSTLNGWTLDITAVPEPVSVALGIFGALAGGASFARWWSRRRAAGAA